MREGEGRWQCRKKEEEEAQERFTFSAEWARWLSDRDER
jgi:hypothetical protein